MMRLLAALLIAAPLAASAQYEPVAPSGDAATSRRSPWYIGFGLGGGGGNVSTPSGDYTLKEYNQAGWLGGVPSTSEVSYNFKLGATLSPTLLIGFDMTGVMSVITESGISGSADIVNYDAVATWFPQGEGFFARAGAGLSRFTLTWDDGTVSGSDSISGFNVLAGVGYAFWLGQTFNLTLNLDYSIQSYGSGTYAGDAERSNFLALWVGFDWY